MLVCIKEVQLKIENIVKIPIIEKILGEEILF